MLLVGLAVAVATGDASIAWTAQLVPEATRTSDRAQRARPVPREARLRRAGIVGLLRG